MRVCVCNQAKEVALLLSSFVVEEKWRLLVKLSPICVLASSLWWTLPQTWRKKLWLNATAANSHGFFSAPPFVCQHVCSCTCTCVHVCLCWSICLNAVGSSVCQVSVIRIISKSHQAEPLISHLAWWTPARGNHGGETRPAMSVLLTYTLHLFECAWLYVPVLKWLEGHWEQILSYSGGGLLVPSSVINAGFAYTTQLMFHDCMARYLTSCGHNYTKTIRERIGRLYIFWNGSNKAA